MGCGDKHGLILSPKSLQLVAKSNASYAEHADGKSHTGGCVGFESDYACWFMWLSTKQPVVALSTCKSELIATCTAGCAVEWARQTVRSRAGICSVDYPDRSRQQMLYAFTGAGGTGSFKRAKHIKVRFFWLKDLIDGDEIILVYVPSEELVADMLTKATTGAKFKYLRGKLLGLMEENA